MRYIDADKLIAEIKRYKNKADERLKIKGRTFGEEQKDLALQNLCGNLLHFITSLQQGQPECLGSLVDVDSVREDFIAEVYRVLDADTTNDRANAIIDAFDSLPTVYQEQPEVDLEKFTEKIKTFQGRYKHPESISIKGAMAFMARMFYQYPNVAKRWYDGLPKATMDDARKEE